MLYPPHPHLRGLLRVSAALAVTLLGASCGDEGQLEVIRDGAVLTDVASPDTLAPPAPSCASDAECDDGLPCTTGRCELGAAVPHCVWSLAPGWCFIGDACYEDEASRPNRACLVCDAAASPHAWLPVADGASCDDGSACTFDTRCRHGECRGERLDCDDGEPCTLDRCDPATGCVFEPLDGLPCDDGLACTSNDLCVQGVCVGLTPTCDDGDPCTDAHCDEVDGCTFVHNEAPCDDGDPCTGGDLCRGGECVGRWAETCDDGNFCTIGHCDPTIGCVHLPTQSPCCVGLVSVCDDGNPCTTDLCDPATGACTYEPNTAPCDDGNACTVDDTCADGVCAGTPRDCDDGNPCTADSCSPQAGCVHSPISGPSCDDGILCTTDPVCVDGACVGDTSACVCEPDLPSDGAKVIALALGEGGHPGEGLDVDQDATTCAPEADCSGGIDNALGMLASLANDPIAGAVAGGDIRLVMTFSAATPGPVELSLFQARLAPSSSGCDHQSAPCEWLVERDMLDPDTCLPLVRLPGTLSGGHLVAGGPGTNLPFELPLSDTASIEVVISNIRVEATVTTSGGRVTGVEGILGGAVPKQAIIDGIHALPDGSLPPPLTKESVLSLVELLIINDIDSTGDGQKDAASIGIKLTAIDATILGATP